jgi:hypothetical protein
MGKKQKLRKLEHHIAEEYQKILDEKEFVKGEWENIDKQINHWLKAETQKLIKSFFRKCELDEWEEWQSQKDD